MPFPSGSPPWITNPGTIRWNVRPSKNPFFTSPAKEAVVQGEVFVASSNVKLPLFVFTSIELVLLSSRSARSAFDLSPLISQSIELPPDALSLLLPPHPTRRTSSAGAGVSRDRLERPPHERLGDLDLVRGPRQRCCVAERLRRVEHPRDRRHAREHEPALVSCARGCDADERERPATA